MFKVRSVSLFHILCLSNSEFYSELFEDAQTPSNTSIFWPLTSPAVQFILHLGCSGRDFWTFGCYSFFMPVACKKTPPIPLTSSLRKRWSPISCSCDESVRTLLGPDLQNILIRFPRRRWKCRTGKFGTVENAGVENAGLEFATPECKGTIPPGYVNQVPASCWG